MKNILKKRDFKWRFKKFIKLRENVHNIRKVCKFKKKKWRGFVHYSNKKFKWYREYKLSNQNFYTVTGERNTYDTHKKVFKSTLQSYKCVKLFYSLKNKKSFKKKLNSLRKSSMKNKVKNTLLKFENRLDVVLYRSKFCYSIKQSQQLILHKKVCVNNVTITNRNFILNTGDKISINKKFYELIVFNILNLNFWPLPPRYLIINYKNLEIIVGDTKNDCLSSLFTFHLNSEKLLHNFTRQ